MSSTTEIECIISVVSNGLKLYYTCNRTIHKVSTPQYTADKRRATVIRNKRNIQRICECIREVHSLFATLEELK